MRITSITVGLARTINLGNFESARLEGAATVEIAEGDDVDIARESAMNELEIQLRSLYAKFKIGERLK
ncbi:MAG: hypothetical protein HYU59_05630 [Magnetospirillum gryphiswaldense]|nr:hypothetical protein [Magnetospirillum gryphiswaldense]